MVKGDGCKLSVKKKPLNRGAYGQLDWSSGERSAGVSMASTVLVTNSAQICLHRESVE
jgi:hypothetical protein